MDYLQRFCREAAQKNWTITFSGELYRIDNREVTVERWMERESAPQARLALLGESEVKSFYLIDDPAQDTMRAQETAQVYPERFKEDAYQEPLLDAVILQAKGLPPECKPTIILPQSLAEFVNGYHCMLLHQEGIAYTAKDRTKPLMIFNPGYSRDVRALIESCHIEDGN